jgi:hypothetical protein
MSQDETNLEVDPVVTESARMANDALALAEVVRATMSEIRSLGEAEPWGCDQPGDQLRRAYLGPDGTDVETLMEGAQVLSDALYQVAEAAGIGAIDSDLADRDMAAEIESLYQQVSGRSARDLLADQAALDTVAELQGRMAALEPRLTELVREPTRAGAESLLTDLEDLTRPNYGGSGS